MAAITFSFNVGTSYSLVDVTDSNSSVIYTVTKRTPTRITVIDENGETVSKKVFVYNGIEYIKPLGSYSMAPTLNADKIIEAHDIDSVFVDFSETGVFEGGKIYLYEEFNDLCKEAVEEVNNMPAKYKGCYAKTYITVNFKDGSYYNFRLDINENEPNIKAAFDHLKKYYSIERPVLGENGKKHADYWKNFSYKY